MDEAKRFEEGLKRHLDHFNTPEEYRKPTRPAAGPSPTVGGYQVQLIVRESRMSMDVVFIHESSKLSVLEAQIDAEKAARDAGWPIIGRLHDIVKI